MRTSMWVIAATAVLGVTATAPAQAAKCIKAGGWGTGVTQDLAGFMATAALKNQAKAWGGDAVKVGKVSSTCKFALPAFECTASARACK